MRRLRALGVVAWVALALLHTHASGQELAGKIIILQYRPVQDASPDDTACIEDDRRFITETRIFHAHKFSRCQNEHWNRRGRDDQGRVYPVMRLRMSRAYVRTAREQYADPGTRRALIPGLLN